MEGNRTQTGYGDIFCGRILRVAERDEREQQRTVARVLSQRTKSLPRGRENIKKESGVN